MNTIMMKYLPAIYLFIFIVNECQSQVNSFKTEIEKRNSTAESKGREKLFIHYDKQYYQLNDTIWIKGYIVHGPMLLMKDSSKIAHLEFIDSDGVLVKRMSALCNLGLFYTNVTLSSQLFKQGVYTLRAYTNRMRGFGDSLFYQSFLKIIDPQSTLWKVALNELSFSDNRLFVAAGLRSEAGALSASQKVEVSLKSGNKTLFRRNMVTNTQGNLYIDTVLKEFNSTKAFRLELANKVLNLKIPLQPSNQKIDLQFLPEGGTFIAGYFQKLGFKALDGYGKGVDVSGKIRDSKGHHIVSFASDHKGIGLVSFTPVAGERYTAFLENGTKYELPSLSSKGWLLQVGYSNKADSILLKIRRTDPDDSMGCFIEGAVRGYNYLHGVLADRNYHEIKIAATTFPSGIARFRLYNGKGVPVSERCLWIWHNDELNLKIGTSKSEYLAKDSVGLQLRSFDESGSVVSGSFSITVIDTSQVKVSANTENIVSYMTLSSDLKGIVEDPYYYIKHPLSSAADALMLTQGWVKYEFDSTKYYDYEKEFTITGKVRNLLNNPSVGSSVTLLGQDGKLGTILLNTVTNKDGIFHFKNFPTFFNDSVSTVINAVNKKDKSFGLGIEVFNNDYPSTPQPEPIYDADNILYDTLAKVVVDRRTAILEQLRRDGRYLEEVTVTARARIPDSKNLNEDGGSDQVINQIVLEKTPKENLRSVLIKNVPGFPVSSRSDSIFRIGKSKIKLIIDGIALEPFDMNPFDIIESYCAEDIKGIEVLRSVRYNISYQIKFNPEEMEYFQKYPPTYIEVTTHGGAGPFLKKIPGMYLFKPDAPFAGRQFYSPKYSSPEQETVFPDLRQTIYWNPDIRTDENGQANVSFYTSESKGSYLIIVQGSDLKGGFGTLTAPLLIKQ